MIYYQKRRDKNLTLIASQFMCLDIETSWNHDEGNPIGWVTSIQIYFESRYYLFRKPSQFITFLKRVKERLGLREDKQVYIYIHNASYDLQYLFQWLEDAFGDHEDMIAINNHKIISVRFDCFVFRCSYKLSNKSLSKWCRDLNTEHKKLDGYYDYSKIIYQDDELNEQEKQYDKMDVLALHDCINKQLISHSDTIATIPLTSTGYIRRTGRNNAKKDQKNREQFRKTALDVEKYNHITNIKSGGLVHGNRRFRRKTLKGKIRHRDFRSHYPSQLRCYKFPLGAWSLYATYEDNQTIDDVLGLFDEYALMVQIVIKDMKLYPNVTIPFAQSYKFYTSTWKDKALHILDDNGRILNMEGWAVVTLSGEMLKIINEQYDFEYEILKVYRSRLDYIPPFLAYTIDTYFKDKSDLKDVVEDCIKKYGEFDARTIDAKINLMKSKNGLNGIFGMCMTDPIRLKFAYNRELNEWEVDRAITDKQIAEQLEKYYNSRNNFLNYSIGVWTTERAKYELYEYIVTIGYDDVIYCDTDSIFYFSNEEIEKRIEDLNSIKHANAEKVGAYIIRDNGERVYYDSFDLEPDIDVFRFLHSKCYALIDSERKELVCTIAGVTATNGKQGKERKTREQELGSIDNLDEGFIFKECGGTRAVYVQRKNGIEVINGHELEVGNACIIMDVQKKLSTGDINLIDDDYYIEEWESL